MNSVETILYTWLSNDPMCYEEIMLYTDSPEELREYTLGLVTAPGDPGRGIFRDILNLVNWHTLYHHIKD